MNVVVYISKELRNHSEESAESDIEELQETDWSSDLESIEDDSIEDRRLFELNYIDPTVCDNDTVDDNSTFQPITDPHISDIRQPPTSPFQHCQPIPIKPSQIQILSPLPSLESDSDSLSSFADSPRSPESPSAIQFDTRFSATKRIYDSPSERNDRTSNDTFRSLSIASVLNSYRSKMPSISSSSAGIELRRFSSSSMFQVYSRPDYITSTSSNLYSQPNGRPFQTRPDTQLSTMNIVEDSEASLDSTGSSPTGLSDDEVSDVFSENVPVIFASTPPLCFRPISRCAGGWGGLEVEEERTRWPLGQRTAGSGMWTTRTRSHVERSTGVRRWSRNFQTRFSTSDISRSAVIQRPSLDFDKMQKSSFGRKHVLNGVSKPRVVKVKNFKSSSCYKSASQLFDPAVFCFRSLSLRHDYRSPAPSPSRRIVHSAPPGSGGEEAGAAESPSNGRGFQNINHVDMFEAQMFVELKSDAANLNQQQITSNVLGLDGRLGQLAGEQSRQGQQEREETREEVERISGDMVSGQSTSNSLVICDQDVTSESVQGSVSTSAEFSSNSCWPYGSS